jgi:hypothetical protein
MGVDESCVVGVSAAVFSVSRFAGERSEVCIDWIIGTFDRVAPGVYVSVSIMVS